MGRTKELLYHITQSELEDLQILYEVLGPECDDS